MSPEFIYSNQIQFNLPQSLCESSDKQKKQCPDSFCLFTLQVKKEVLVKALTLRRVVTAHGTAVTQYAPQEVYNLHTVNHLCAVLRFHVTDFPLIYYTIIPCCLCVGR